MSNKHQTTSSHSVFHFVQSPMKRALICDCLWQNIVCLCPSTTAHVAVCHFVLSNQRLWKTAEILPFTWMQKSFQRIPSGNIHNNITTWASLKSQMLFLPLGIETVKTSWQMLDLLPPYLFTKQVLHMGLQSQWWFPWLNTLGIRLSPRWKNQSSPNAW